MCGYAIVHHLRRPLCLLLGVPAAPRLPGRRRRLVLPAGEALALGGLAVRPVSHLGEGVRAPVPGGPAMVGPQRLSLRGLAGGGPLEPDRDPLGRTGHQRDGLTLQIRARGGHTGELKHLIVIW